MQGQVRKFKSSVVPENEITPKSELFRLRRLVWLNRKERGEVIMRGELKLLSHGGGGGVVVADTPDTRYDSYYCCL